MAKLITKETRKLDGLRRLVLPSAVREFGWEEGRPLDIFIMDDETVILKSYEPCCKMCGDSGKGLIVILTGCICFNCFNEAKKA